MMKKVLIGTTALALVAGTVAMPNKADAQVWWLWPAVIAGGTGLVVGGAAVAAADSQYGYYGPRGDITVRRPAAGLPANAAPTVTGIRFRFAAKTPNIA